MRWRGGRRYGNIEDRRGLRGAGAGGIGIGGIAIALIGYFVFGIDPALLLNAGAPYEDAQSGVGGTPADEAGQFVDTILSSTTDVWRRQIADYEPPGPLVLYEQATGTQCGMGQAAMGPFYCPLDRRIYIDLDFYRELETRFGAPGDFARAYVIAHEVGHHVQTLLGTSAEVRRRQQAARSETEANRYSVALELQADCFAGVWAASAAQASGGAVALEEGDLAEGLTAASAIGDDTLQRRSQGRVVPDSFTHGTSEQRQYWLRRGYEGGSASACDTFSQR